MTPSDPPSRVTRFRRARRRRRYHGHLRGLLFRAFAMSSVLSLGVGAAVFGFFGTRVEWDRQLARLERFVGGRFDAVFDDPAGRADLTRSIARDLDVGVTVRDARGTVIESAGRTNGCQAVARVDVGPTRPARGRVDFCFPRRTTAMEPFLPFLALFFVSGFWAFLSSKVARKLAYPLERLTRVARELGEGKLETRAEIRHGGKGEIGDLAHAMNEMAERIERQVKGQKELLAAVSHELRTPLARMRVLAALARDEGADESRMNAIDAEVVEMDALVADLLAGSRVDFSALARKKLELVEVARDALSRSGLADATLEHDGSAAIVDADPTLLTRAISILLDNARKHGRAPYVVRVASRGDRVVATVEDSGPGFDEADLPRVFLPFVRGRGDALDEAVGVGLGLALVRRIAEAHGGAAFAENRAEGGARVGVELALRMRPSSVPPAPPSSGRAARPKRHVA